MYSIDCHWPGESEAIDASTLKAYDFSARIKLLFCGTCSGTMFWRTPAAGAPGGSEYGVFTGALLNEGPNGLVRLVEHIFVSDTVDGGATEWLRAPNGDGVHVPRWAGRRDKELSEEWPGTSLPAARWKSEAQDVPIQCHCKGIDLVLRRRGADAEFAVTPSADLPHFVDPVSQKPVAGPDACDSCRTSSGVDFFDWTFSFLRHIGFAVVSRAGEMGDLTPFPASSADLYTAVTAPTERRDPRLGTLAAYRSSDHTKRYFCSRCSACVFLAADRRPDVVDVAVGLLASPDGTARAEGALLWLLGGPVQHREDVKGGWREDWLNAVEMESESWRVKRDFPEWWRLRKAKPEKDCP